jgi:hypothetical protein
MTDCRFRVFDQGFDDALPAAADSVVYRLVSPDDFASKEPSSDMNHPVSSWS